jgi:uncharacterized LabA/DUF88 family protein
MVNPIPPQAMERAMIFIDGENLVFRYQDMLKNGKKPNPNTKHQPDTFIWHEHLSGTVQARVVRVGYYTSVVGDDLLLQNVRAALAAIEAPRLRMTSIQVCPFVYKRPSKSQKNKIVDVNLTIDVLRHTYQGDVDIVCLVSGDGDYLPLIKEVMRHGKQVHVFAFSSGLAEELRYTADHFQLLDQWFFLD